MQRIFTLLILLIGLNLNAQTTSDFEDIPLDMDSYLNGSEGSGGYTSGNIFLPNFYTDAYGGLWSGWAISNTTDVTTSGFTNQFSPITGGGAEASENFALSYISLFGPGPTYSIMELQNMAVGEVVNGLSITNGTYPYFSMLNGDQFAKKFGGATGNDPDYLRLTIKKYLDGALSTDSVDFYLADYRFEDNTMDYIVDEWTYVDLTSLGAADSLIFTMTSTDIGAAGINTPLYFFVDNVITSDGTTPVIELSNRNAYEIYPNPANDFVILKSDTPQEAELRIIDILGKVIFQQSLNDTQTQIDLNQLAKGTYLLEILSQDGKETEMLIKQ